VHALHTVHAVPDLRIVAGRILLRRFRSFWILQFRDHRDQISGGSAGQ